MIQIYPELIPIPTALSVRVQSYQPGDHILGWEDIREGNGVDTGTFGRLEFVVCDGYCEWHTDEHLPVMYSSLLVLRNDTRSWVQSKHCRLHPDQTVGTLILLDVRKEHRLNCPGGAKGVRGVWLAACIDYEDRRLTKREWHDDMKVLLDNYERPKEEKRP